MMVCLLIWAMYFLKRWTEQPDSFARMLPLGITAGLCIFIKQVAAFPLGLAIAAGLIASRGLGASLKNRRVWLAAVLCLAPMLIYNYWGYFVEGFLIQQYQGRFFLSELISPSFYVRWLRMIDKVFTLPLFIAALVGILLIRDKNTRAAWIAYFAGYVVYGLCLAHHIGTHDYYQLLLFPLAALGIGSLVSRIAEALNGKRLLRAGAVLCGVFLCAWWAADSVMTMHRKDYRAWPQRWKDWMSELEPYAGSISTIGIMDDYGGGMTYWGLHNPGIWDTSVERMDEYDALVTLNTTFWNYRWLVVTDLEKFYEQPRLQRYLNENASVYRQESDYIIYDLEH